MNDLIGIGEFITGLVFFVVVAIGFYFADKFKDSSDEFSKTFR